MKRRNFLLMSTAAAGSAAIIPVTFANANQQQEDPPSQLDANTVKRFVGASHGNYSIVKEMLEGEPMLVNASWDWVDGDWETGLGAASHVGNRGIAEMLLEKGARINIFAMTMLGHTEMVKAVLASYPNTHKTPGPHGIPLLSHAIFGKEHADAVTQLLIDGGADINAASNTGQTPLMAAASTGRAERVEQLLELGAEMTARDSKDRSALDFARARKHNAVVKLLEARGSK